MTNKLLAIGFILSISMSINAQVAMGGWRTHFSYNNVSQVTQSENKVYALSDGAMYSINKNDGLTELYNKTNGLNGTHISQIEYDKINEILLIVYSDGNIDAIKKNGINNLPDFFNKQTITNKKINHIQFFQKKAYLASNFGIIVLNLEKNEVADTYYIGPNATEVEVLNTCIFNDKIYALTPSTIFNASISNPNLANYEFWSGTSGLPGSGKFQSIKVFNGKLVLQRQGKLYINNEGVWTQYLSTINVDFFSISNNKMVVSDNTNTMYIVDESLNVETISIDGKISDAEFDSANNRYWLAAKSLGVVSYKQTGIFNYFKPDGPNINRPFDLRFGGEKLFMVPGGRWAFELQPAQIMMYNADKSSNSTNKWSNITNKAIVDKTNVVCTDFVSIAIDPADNTHFFASSYSSGLYEFRNNEFYFYHNFSNSTIEVAIAPGVPPGSYQYQMLGGSVFDKDGNLWVINQYASNGVKVLLEDGTWTQLPYPGISPLAPSMGEIIISNQNPNQKWIYSARPPQGIFVFDDKGTISKTSDDDSYFFRTFTDPESGDSFSPLKYFSIAQDKKGVIWVGTEQGPILFNNPSKVFEKGYSCSRIKIPRNDNTGLADYLLSNESVNCIAIDGANRKWLGTKSSGVYLMSENGQETIRHFTMNNSPLLSNDILSIAIHPTSGEVFIGTSAGLISYQSDAGFADKTFGNVYAYPNPVREGFNGVITITGLVDNTQVKITDLNGNLICQTVSNGNMATWNGKNMQDQKVSTGIYLAICVNEDGTQSTITKIMIIN